MQKQTKPEPLRVPMEKLVLVVAIIVFLGAVLGVAGWMVKNKPKTILPIAPSIQEKVIISTDKTEYEIGEMVKITLENDLDKEINHNYGGCGGYSFNVQKFIDGKWEYLNTFWEAVESGKSEVYNWDQKAYDDSLAKNSLKQVSSGTYRISITYIADKKVETVYFNEFTIKGKSADETTDWKTYRNEEYGFEITLLESWKGYSILENTWSGTTLDGSSKQYQGPQIIIRNLKWSEAQPWQDIPIMVFTKEEWGLIEVQNLNVSAAPIGPSKLGENQRYVFSLPPRWIGFTDVLGQNEAEEIVKTFKAITVDEAFDETADWKTYRNEEYGFEIKYPTTTIYNGLGFYPIEKMGDYIVVIQGSLSDEVKNPYSPYPFVGGLGIKIIKPATSDPVEELKNKMRKRHLTEEYIKDTIKEVTIGKLTPAIRVNNYGKLQGSDIYIKRPDEIIMISFDNPGKNYYSKIFEKMLSTFKFIEKDETNETANWKNYKNDEYGFNIKYPQDWKTYELNTKIVDITSYDLYDPKFELGNANGVKIQIQTELLDQITTLDKFVPLIDDLTSEALKTEKIVLNSYEARKADMNGATVYFLINGKTGISIFIWKGDNRNLNKVADQILSTFKFIEADETADWKTYRNEDLGFELKYPSDVIVDREYNDKYNRLVIFTGREGSFEVRIRDGKAISLDKYHFLDFLVSSKSVLGGKEALIFEAPHGYCDGPGCSKPFIAYSAKNGDDFYNLVFYRDTNLSDKEKNILSTFKFIEKDEEKTN